MLNSILIQNIVLIEKLEVKMASGFCVLTGETGSGKSILLDALGLAIGQRSNIRLLREGSKQGLVVAEFNIANNLPCQKLLEVNGLANLENHSVLVLRRTISDNGTSKAFVNDVPISINLLAQIGDTLIEIHGQHEQRGLLNPSCHQEILDQYSKSGAILQATNSAFDQWREIEKKIVVLNAERAANEREKDYLNHIIKELELAKIEVGEEESLTEKRYLLVNKEKIFTLAQEVSNEISDANNRLFSAQKSLIRNQNLGNFLNGQSNNENKFEKLTEVIDQILIKSEEAKNIANNIIESFAEEELSLEEIEERLFSIRNISKKLNTPINQLPAFLEDCQKKLKLIENFDFVIHDLEKAKIQSESDYLKNARELSRIRAKSAIELGKIVERELAFLKMATVKFEIRIVELAKENYRRDGIDNIRFVAATNPNSSLDEIAKIASGGELSRFMLALKVALSGIKSVPILIFDEIDTGIGGAVANSVGERLKLLSQQLQILVVTHQPQIAAKADHHLRVKKTNNDQTTNSIVEVLDSNQREQEIARMLSGESITSEALAAAKSLIYQK